MTDKSIRRTDILPPGCRARGLLLQHPEVSVLRRGGIAMAGIDDRVPGSDWGEGYSATHLLYVVVKGVTEVEDLQAGPGEVLVLPAGSYKRLSCPDTRQQAVYAHVKDKGDWVRLRGERVRSFPSQHSRILLPLMEQLLRETRGGGSKTLSHLSALFLQYLREEVLVPSSPLEQEQRMVLESIWQTVAVRPEENWTVPVLSRMAHLSAGHFHRLVRHLEGTSPMGKVLQLRMEEAMGLLRTTSLTLDAIAARVGYRTAFAFSEAFKKYAGLRPSRYRRS